MRRSAADKVRAVEGRVLPGAGASGQRDDAAHVRGARAARSAAAAATLLGVAATVVAAATSGFDLSFRGPETKVAIEVAAAIVPAIVAYLFFGRAKRSGELVDVAMAVTMATLTLTNFGFAVVPLLTGVNSETFSEWAAFFGRLVTVVGFGAAAFAPDRRVTDPRRAFLRLCIGGAFVLAAVSSLVDIFEEHLPPVVEANGQAMTFDTTVATVQLIAVGFYLMAAWGFVRRTERSNEQLMVWLAVSMALSAVASLNFVLDPTLLSGHVYSGDLLRLAANLALLIGAFREIESYQRRVAESAVFQERRRLARDLHDGLAQELSYITAQSKRLASGHPERRRASDTLVSAAERALEESRMAISALTRPIDEPLSRALVHTARSVADRVDVVVETRVDSGVEVPPDVREAMLRIVAEAIRNAARHGGAKTVWLTLERDEGVCLSVRDDGRGFDPEIERRPDSLGLRSMQERAEGLGAELRVLSSPGEGTTVELRLP